MKSLRQLCATTILTLTLTVAAYAGQIQCPAAVPPPPTGGDTTATIILAVVTVIYR
jgi:hypothetical protein